MRLRRRALVDGDSLNDLSEVDPNSRRFLSLSEGIAGCATAITGKVREREASGIKKPLCVVVFGDNGAGKTEFISELRGRLSFPAAHVDVRDEKDLFPHDLSKGLSFGWDLKLGTLLRNSSRDCRVLFYEGARAFPDDVEDIDFFVLMVADSKTREYRIKTRPYPTQTAGKPFHCGQKYPKPDVIVNTSEKLE